ncbi:2-hydroxyacid dehydrogenase [Aeromicrobium camelliae]|uniref:2-hydroxyacid dehydrogenase n=1 Tax=Aeromicrobium camelliae TaxID=1538144 RepID=A0A3N6WML5_9ACTN|nr:2-hydroxyacid dehydrogenase [Aeromicrobium camelliae]RQN08806.1 2-hydroxyacid dehydrogenase [Aeromicrobium camelliae]
MPAHAVVLTAPLPGSLDATVRERYGAVGWEEARAAGELAGARVAVTTARFGVTSELLDAAPGLEAIVSYGAGYDNLDLPRLVERGIRVSTTPDVLSAAVADTAVGLLIDVLRGLTEADRFVREGRWHDAPFPFRRDVTGRRVGILGLGRIGRAIARRLEGFDCEISYHSRRPRTDVPYRYAEDVHALARDADALVIAAPGGAHTRHLVDADVLRALGPDGVLVNIARGSVVDENALIAALRDGTIAGAGLDVFTDEPRVPAGLLDLPQVVLTPHLGSATVETRAAMAAGVLANLDAWADRGDLATPLDLNAAMA